MSAKKGQQNQHGRDREQAVYLYVVGRQCGESTVPRQPGPEAYSAAVGSAARG